MNNGASSIEEVCRQIQTHIREHKRLSIILARQLSAYRETNGISQRMFASWIGVDIALISRIESHLVKPGDKVVAGILENIEMFNNPTKYPRTQKELKNNAKNPLPTLPRGTRHKGDSAVLGHDSQVSQV